MQLKYIMGKRSKCTTSKNIRGEDILMSLQLEFVSKNKELRLAEASL